MKIKLKLTSFDSLFEGSALSAQETVEFSTHLLDPIEIMAEAGGPIKVIPFLANSSENFAFSDRKPYPGWTA